MEHICFLCQENATYSIGSQHVCISCIRQYYYQCSSCGQYHHKIGSKSLYRLLDGTVRNAFEHIHNTTDQICQSCFKKAIDRYIKEGGVECNRCGRLCKNGTVCGNHYYCEYCARHVRMCSSCKEYTYQPYTSDTSGESICRECVKGKGTKYIKCSACSRVHKIQKGGLYNTSRFLCNHCINTYTPCARCSRFEITKDGTLANDGTFFCSRCAASYGGVHCQSCGDSMITKHSVDGKYYCTKCAASKAIVLRREYNYVPTYFHFHKNAKEPSCQTPLYLGFENEFIVPTVKAVSLNMAAILKNYTEKDIYCVFDGSIGDDERRLHGLTGFEIVSHPRTLASHVAVNWSKLFTKQAKVDPTCGMHVHLSRSCFTTFHLYKFMKFVYSNIKFMEAIAERKPNQYTLSITPNSVVRNAKAGYKKKSHEERRVKVNLTNRFTVELRIFANAATQETLLKNLEFAHALFYFTQINTKRDSQSPAKFKQHVVRNTDLYPNLVNFIIDKEL